MKRSAKRGWLLLLAAFPVALWLTSWEIEEARFSPFTLEYQKRRSFVVFAAELPLYRSNWEPAPNDVLDYVRDSRMVEPLQGSDVRWDLVHRFKTGHAGGWKRPYSSLRADLVDWSKRHPEIASTFWQTGFKLVRSEVENEVDAGYVLLGDFSQVCETPIDLRVHLENLEQIFKISVLTEAHSHLPRPTKKKERPAGPGGPPSMRGKERRI